MQTDPSEALQAIRQLEPITIAGRLRPLMPEIERKLADGVRLAAIHRALVGVGFDMTLQTLSAYVSRHRKRAAKTVPRSTTPTAAPVAAAPAGIAPSAGNQDRALPITRSALVAASARRHEPPSPQEQLRLLRSDPDEEAVEMDGYDRMGKEMARRERKAKPNS